MFILLFSIEPIGYEELPCKYESAGQRLNGVTPQPPLIKATVYTQVWIKAKTLEIPLNPP